MNTFGKQLAMFPRQNHFDSSILRRAATRNDDYDRFTGAPPGCMADAAFCGCVLPALGCKKLCVYPSSLSVLAGSIARSRSPGCDILCALPPAAQTHAKAPLRSQHLDPR